MKTANSVSFDNGLLRVPYLKSAPLAQVAPLAVFRRAKTPAWTCPASDVSAVVKWASENGVSVDDDVKEWDLGEWTHALDSAALARATTLPPHLSPITATGLTSTMLPPQDVVTVAARNAWVRAPKQKGKPYRALLVADEPGMGKTIMALAALRDDANPVQKAVIVCPASLTETWKNEMLKHFEITAFCPWIATGKTPTEVPGEADVVIVGWSILAEWAETLAGWSPQAVVADEGHYAKSGREKFKTESRPVLDDNGTPVRDEQGQILIHETTEKVSGAARATGLMDLGASVREQGGIVLALTGTPIVNRPLELEPILEFLGVLHIFGGAGAYKNRYCGPVKVKGKAYVMDYSNASNLGELNTRLICSGHYVRRSKESLVNDGILKQKYVDGVYCYERGRVTPRPWRIHASPTEMEEYAKAQADLARYFTEQARQIAQELGVPMNHPLVKRKFVSKTTEHLQRLGVLRQIAARVKMPHVVNNVNALVDRGEKVVIAAHHRDIVNGYADAYSGLKIQGGMSVRSVEKTKALFNSTPASEHPVLVLSVEAGKTGHTLCLQEANNAGPSCAHMVAAEQVWTPGDDAQMQDRIWRIGQSREVRILNALLSGSVDDKIYGVRVQKKAVVDAAVDAKSGTGSAAEKRVAGQVAWSLIPGTNDNERVLV